MFDCIESTVEFTVTLFLGEKQRGIRIRLWINRDSIPEHFVAEKELIKNLSNDPFYSTWSDLAETLKLIPNINAFQVMDVDTRLGFVCYTVPFTDVHG